MRAIWHKPILFHSFLTSIEEIVYIITYIDLCVLFFSFSKGPTTSIQLHPGLIKLKPGTERAVKTVAGGARTARLGRLYRTRT